MARHVDFIHDRYRNGDLLPLNKVSGFLEGNPVSGLEVEKMRLLGNSV